MASTATADIETPPPERRVGPPAWKIWGGGVLVFLLLLAVFLYFFQWNWLRGPIARYASRQTGRVVRIEGDLKVHLFSWAPTATVNGLKISNPDWAEKGQTADIPKLTIQARLMPLLGGHLVLPRVELDQPRFVLYRDAQGRATWEFGSNAKDNAKPVKLPPIENFAINDGKLEITDLRRHLTFAGTLQSHEAPRAGERSAFSMLGKGSLNHRPFLMEVTGGPLLNIDRAKPYPFTLKVRAGATRVDADVSVTHPFDLGGMEATATFAGPNLAEGYYLTGVVLPNTAPYKLSTQISRNNTVYTLTGIAGTVGNSDLEGNLTIDVTTGRPNLTGDLKSRLLDFVDLAPLLGGRPSAAHIAKAAAKAGVSVSDAAEDAPPPPPAGHILPDMPLNVDRVRQMDAKLTYHAESIRSASLPLRQFTLGMNLDHGLLTLDPISFSLKQGKLAGSARIDARNRVPDVGVDVRLRDLSLEQFIHVAEDKDAIVGLLQARAKLRGAGKSVHDVASDANGNVTIVIPHGTIRQRFAELLGIDIDRALLFSGDKDTGLRCAVADFQANRGVLTARNLTLDTNVIKATGQGTIGLRDESLNLSISGEPKEITFFRLRAPITVTGTMSHPSLGIKPAGAIAQAGIGAALGALVFPPLAILPFVDPGLARDANCSALVSEAKSKGAPVHAAVPKTPLRHRRLHRH